ncbi:MAG: phenylphosphate carboxylase subunit beta [Deltaproteobacteria bacterium]|nr:phenylphosphate carboxylase subunit beta [Deltaproteobacteria bacterium]
MKDIRDFIAKCEQEGILHRIKAPVDVHLELSHTAKINEEAGGPVLLFENVKGFNMPVLISACTTPKKMAVILGQPTDKTMCQLSREWMKLTTKELIPPKVVSNPPVMENVITGDAINVNKFPAPHFYPLDGGRFIGTSAFLVTKDPDTGWTNLGTYRMQILDDKSVGVQIIKGKHADMMMKKYQAMGKKMPVAAVIGSDPILFLTGSTLVSSQVDEYDVSGSLRGEPVEIFESDLTGLKLPANAEIILEGEIDPENLRPEGPFGEYTGYYSGSKGKDFPKPWIDVKRVLHRNNPIFWSTTVGKPINDIHMIQSLNRTATLWYDLETMKVPGIQSVYIPANSTGRFWAIVSIKQMYPGHGCHAGNAVIASTTGHYGLKGVIVVDHDIPADDWDRIMWALSVRFDPLRDTQIINRGRSTPLDPALPIEAREIVSRIIMDATTPYEWKDKPIEIFMDKDMTKQVLSRWNEFGFEGIGVFPTKIDY